MSRFSLVSPSLEKRIPHPDTWDTSAKHHNSRRKGVARALCKSRTRGKYIRAGRKLGSRSKNSTSAHLWTVTKLALGDGEYEQ